MTIRSLEVIYTWYTFTSLHKTVPSQFMIDNAVFSLAFFNVAGPHAVNLGRYTVLQAATLSFERRGG